MASSLESKEMPVLAIVVPCYNEEPVVRETAKRLFVVLEQLQADLKISKESFLYFVDDGSRDRTWEIIEYLHAENKSVKGLKLARNAGHQNALLAGLLTARDRFDCAVTIDADLQDDISVITSMVESFRAGNGIVYGVRKERKTDSFLKRTTAVLFYKLMQALGADIVYNHADFRLCSKRVIDELAEFREVNLFLRGIFPLLGFRSEKIYYDRQERFAGVTKYPLKKMFSFAVEGITSFSVTPMRLVTITGLLVFFVSFILGMWALLSVFSVQVVPGWASTVIPIYFLGGIQLLSIGLIGEYIGKIYKEVKARPRFIRDKELS